MGLELDGLDKQGGLDKLDCNEFGGLGFLL